MVDDNMKPKFKQINKNPWSLPHVRKIGNRVKKGEELETEVSTDDMHGLMNLKSNLIKAFGAGSFSTTTVGSDGSRLQYAWIRRNKDK